MPGEQLEVWPWTALFDQVVEFIWLTRMFALLRRKQVDLTATRSERPQIAAHTKEHKLSDIAEIESNATPIWTTILACLVPDKVCLVGEAPAFHHLKPFHDQRIGNPEIEVAARLREPRNWQIHDLIQREGGVARKTPMLRRHLPCSIGKLPRRVSQDRPKLFSASIQACLQEIVRRRTLYCAHGLVSST